MINNQASIPMFRICILNWNGGEDLKLCIDSIKKNQYENYTITIIDNNSSDFSLSGIDKEIEIIRLQENNGFSKGYNIGLKKCVTNNDDYLILLNFDTIVESNFIYEIAKNINHTNKEYIYGVKILYENNRDMVWYAGGEVQLDKGIISHKGIGDSSNIFSTNYETDYVTGCCMIVHKDIFFRLDGFDQQFFMYSEDVDFCLRAKEQGIKCKFLSSPIIFHKISLSTGGNYSTKKVLMKIKSSYLLYRKYYPMLTSLILLIYYLAKSFNKGFNIKVNSYE